MAQSEFAIGIKVDGAGEAQKQFSELEKSQKSVAKASEDASKTASAGLAAFGNSIKDVGKDLDNFGLGAGKAFAMTAEGAISVVAALSAGGVAGLIGAATVAAGALVELAHAHETAEEAAAKQFKTYKDEVSRITDMILASRKVLSQEDFVKREAELLARRGANEGRYWDEVLARDKVTAAKRAAAQLEGIPGAGALATKQLKDAEANLLRIQKERADESLAIEHDTRANNDAAAKADGVAFGKWLVENDTKNRDERHKAAEVAREKSWKAEVEYWYRVVKDANAATSKIIAARKTQADIEAREVKSRSDKWQTDADAWTKVVESSEKKLEDRRLKAMKDHTDGLLAVRERDVQFALGRADLTREEFVREQHALDAIAAERERNALDITAMEMDRAIERKEITASEATEIIEIERVATEERIKLRNKETEITVANYDRQREAAKNAARATDMATAVNYSFGVASMAVTPMITGMSNAVGRLGELNRENAWQIRDFIDDLPALVAKEAQAFSARIAAEAIGKAGMSMMDAGRETALGVGMLFIPGGQGAAAGHFKAAAIHASMAAGYAGLAGVGIGGAVGIGMARGEGGIVGLPKSEKDTINMRRDEESGSWVPTSSGGGGSMGGDNGAFVVNITNEAGSIAPDDQRRAARVVASSVLRARSNAFDRRRMGA